MDSLVSFWENDLKNWPASPLNLLAFLSISEVFWTSKPVGFSEVMQTVVLSLLLFEFAFLIACSSAFGLVWWLSYCRVELTKLLGSLNLRSRPSDRRSKNNWQFLEKISINGSAFDGESGSIISSSGLESVRDFKSPNPSLAASGQPLVNLFDLL